MAKRNVTVQLDERVVHRAKVLAARRGTSVSALVAQQIEDLADADERYEQARQESMKWFRKGHQGGTRTWTREELYDR